MTVLTWPTGRYISNHVEFYLQNNNTPFESPITRTRQVLGRQGARWVCTMTLPPMPRRLWQPFDAFLEKLRGSLNTVMIYDQAQPEPLGPNLDLSSLRTTYLNTPGSPGGLTGFTNPGSPTLVTGFSGGPAGITVYGSYAARVRSVTARGFPQFTTQLLAGEYVEINGRLYKLTEDAAADGLNRATLSLNRGLVNAVTHGMAVTRTRAATPMRLSDDDQPRGSVGLGNYKSYSLSFVEDLTPQ